MIKYAVKLLKNSFNPVSIPDSVDVVHGDLILVRTEKGEEVAKVEKVCPAIAQKWEGKAPPSLPFLRVLSENDKKHYEQIQKEEKEAYKTCLRLIGEHNLSMNLVEVRYTFDKRKITFYYTAPSRVDFRGLLKDLTQEFRRVRIDLRHIGVRDETSLMQGNGLCGKPYCCCTFLRNFESINIKLAKDQGMPINPSKISGVCGRLLCCLNYEYSNYLDAAKGMPPVGSGVMTADGIGRVSSLHFLNGKVAVKLEDGKVKDYTKDEIEMIDEDVNNIEIEEAPCPYKNQDDEESQVNIKDLEDDSNSVTGNI